MVLHRFRTRVLAVLLLVAACILVSNYYLPTPYAIKINLPQPSQWILKKANLDCANRKHMPDYDWKTSEVYSTLDFSVPDNGGMGFWNDVLESRYRRIKETWKTLPLEVVVVPHAHVDPGWLRTFEDYHQNSVTHILDNMVKFLNETEDFRFIWSEISFFSEWWARQSNEIKDTVKSILKKKQLEFVTGGWVMPDEAVTSYFSQIDQLIEGHQWLHHFLGELPQNGWSVDVFGHSGSYPYILSSAGIYKMVILRTHYAWKKFLAHHESFDFYWDQPFPAPRSICHMAPSDLYSFKYTCGPDTFACLKYDFRYVEGEYSESKANKITDENVELKAGYLLTQYGRYASLFHHNVLLVPLGDDFRYNVYSEWVQQMENYKKLFDYINKRKDWNAHVSFGTVSEYFEKVAKRFEGGVINTLRSVQGDFFPYADIYANARASYWTGFYTTRPFYKKLAQELEYWLRTAEILYSLSKVHYLGSFRELFLKDYSFLISARQKLALFQHHDAITGTSKENVMLDYAKKLHSGIIDVMSVVSHITQLLMMKNISPRNTWTSQVYPAFYRSSYNQPTKKLSVSVPENGRKIILFNSLATERTEIIHMKVKSFLLKVVDSDSNDVPFQINPVFREGLLASNLMYELVFVANLKPLSFCTFTIVQISDRDKSNFPKTVVSLFLNDDVTESHNSAFSFEKPKKEDIRLESSNLVVTFSSTGHLQKIHVKESGNEKIINLDFLAYIPFEYRSGAYLFSPDIHDPIPVRNLSSHFPLLSVIKGPVLSEVIISYQNFLKYSLRLYHFKNAPPGLQLEVTSDISKITSDVELIMRIQSDIQNDRVFYTDSNGFQIFERKYLTQLPVQGNYYPATSTVFIQDNDLRLNVLLPHSHGVTSTAGQVEIMIDRKMKTDDGRGLGEGIQDNQKITTTFWLLFESSPYEDNQASDNAHLLTLFLQYPPSVFVSEYSHTKYVKTEYSFLQDPWPPDVHLVNLRTLPSVESYEIPSNDSLLVIYQKNVICDPYAFLTQVIRNLENYSLFKSIKIDSLIRTTLTGTSLYPENNELKILGPEKLQVCKLSLKSEFS